MDVGDGQLNLKKEQQEWVAVKYIAWKYGLFLEREAGPEGYKYTLSIPSDRNIPLDVRNRLAFAISDIYIILLPEEMYRKRAKIMNSLLRDKVESVIDDIRIKLDLMEMKKKGNMQPLSSMLDTFKEVIPPEMDVDDLF